MALEAFLNECVFTESERLEQEAVERLRRLDRLPTEERFLQTTEFMWRNTFNRGTRPFQAFHHLKMVRDGLAHYKFGEPPAESLQYLASQGLLTVERWPDTTVLWAQVLWTRGFARWSYDIVCKMAQEMLAMIPDDAWHNGIRIAGLSNFSSDALNQPE
jgi:hypothetical protein